ncbi:MAG: hypothetical protein ACK4XY_08360 [Chloroherpetonaceae bacterium]
MPRYFKPFSTRRRHS